MKRKEKRIRTLYHWLGVSEDASQDEIKKAWKEMAKIHHPDRGGDAHRFSKIQQAYTTLADVSTRSKYDRKVRMVRIRVRMENVRDQVFSKFEDAWDAETEAYEERRRREEEDRRRRNAASPNADYFAQQEKAEREWKNQYDAMMEDYYRGDTHTKGMEDILHSTDELLYSILTDGIIRMGRHQVGGDPVGAKVEPEIKVQGKARDVVSDLRDTIVRAERLVRIFNKFTGGI